jgi:hypothetical protein
MLAVGQLLVNVCPSDNWFIDQVIGYIDLPVANYFHVELLRRSTPNHIP